MSQWTESITRFYGIDWLATLFTCLAIFRLGEKKRDGFIHGIVSNVAWFVFALMFQTYALLVANLLFLGINIRGYYKWRQ